MNTLFFDTETTGLPPAGAHYKEDKECFPHLVQIAWATNEEEINCHIIKPLDWLVPEEATLIHKISHERALEEGKGLKEVLTRFLEDCKKAEKIVAHNIYFDVSIIKSELYRLEFEEGLISEALHKNKRIDTLRKTVKFVNAEFKDGRKGKWPKLEELYFKLFNKEMEGIHDASNDVRALRECYYELIKLDIIN